MDSCLYLSSTSVFQGSQLRPVENGSSLDLSCASIVTNSGREDFSKSVAGQKFDTALSYADAPGHHSSTMISQIASCLRPGGSVKVTEPQTAASETGAALRKAMLLAGLTDIAVDTIAHSAVMATGRKPAWETGASMALPRKATAAKPQSAAPAKSAWSLAPDDEDVELLDDSELLTEEDLQRPSVPSVGDCSTGATKKACANCTCGRAEEEAQGIKASLTADMLDNPQSACGSCGLGDAFRCSTCPYRGLPKFEMGQKVELPSDFLTADA
ncbi:hypothetical protein CVIRNUC_009158 [Coccomyxa viridis]|uniref:Anamorsin homolog n=1 Tax=Coccomyxa viridis TaxID=1274662 RepID=A0AAV1IIT6_9CHLO|nr:hypothetical protein CVIRNUC_009158 [Coccomyxa viridis]